MGRKPRAREQVALASPEVASLRRTVWRRRLLVLLVVATTVCSYYLYLDRRVAHLRDPAVALAPDSQVYRDALRFLVTPGAQLTLQATATSFLRYGTPGPLTLQSLRSEARTGRVWISLASYGTVSETGCPVVYPDVDYRITQHSLDSFGLVRKVTVECRYVVCWDRAASQGRALGNGDPLPDLDAPELVQGYLSRFSAPQLVTDVLTMNLSGHSRRWEVLLVQRMESRSQVH